ATRSIAAARSRRASRSSRARRARSSSAAATLGPFDAQSPPFAPLVDAPREEPRSQLRDLAALAQEPPSLRGQVRDHELLLRIARATGGGRLRVPALRRDPVAQAIGRHG